MNNTAACGIFTDRVVKSLDPRARCPVPVGRATVAGVLFPSWECDEPDGELAVEVDQDAHYRADEF